MFYIKKRQKYIFTEEQDKLIIKAYTELRNKNPVVFLLSLPEFTNYTRHLIKKRSRELNVGIIKSDIIYKFSKSDNDLIIQAYNTKRFPVPFLKKVYPQFSLLTDRMLWNQASKLGVARQKRWSKEEKDILDKHLGDLPLQKIVEMLKRKGYKRSEKAIRSYASSVLRHSVRPDDLCSINSLCIGLGCGRIKVYHWIKYGKLKAEFDEKYHTWRIKPKEVAKLILEYPDELDMSRPSLPWVISLIKEFYVQIQRENQGKKRDSR